MNFFKINFKKKDVHECNKNESEDLKASVISLNEAMTKKLEELKEKLNSTF